jgi:hypothetical protein
VGYALNAFGLFARPATPVLARQVGGAPYASSKVGRPKQFEHRITVRLGDEHAEHLHGLSRQSGLDRNEVVRRLILGGEISSSDAFEGLQKIQRVQAEQNRLGGLLKLALTGTVDKGATRRALAEVERTSAELRSLIGRLAERV